jgi:hypothetical protein
MAIRGSWSICLSLNALFIACYLTTYFVCEGAQSRQATVQYLNRASKWDSQNRIHTVVASDNHLDSKFAFRRKRQALSSPNNFTKAVRIWFLHLEKSCFCYKETVASQSKTGFYLANLVM